MTSKENLDLAGRHIREALSHLESAIAVARTDDNISEEEGITLSDEINISLQKVRALLMWIEQLKEFD